MKITFFKASVPLTKSYTRKIDGTIGKTSYPSAYEFTSITENTVDLRGMSQLLAKHAALGHCLVKGNPTRALVCESRAGTTDSNAATDWIVLDIDGLPNVSTIDDFMKALHFEEVSHVIQWSASYGVENLDLRAHIFMRLDKPMPAQLIKQWLVQLNHTVSILKDAMGLTKTGNSISWPLDISACQNDKLLYIAPPLFKNLKDPMTKAARIVYVRRASETLVLTSTINSTAQNRVLTDKRINEIRSTLGFPARKTTYKMHGNVEVMVKPDSCIVSDMKIERGFVYFNLNGGDSWGYYHPEDNPDYIHNFKGEPSYVTKELLPEYWSSLTAQGTRVSSQGVQYLMFCERRTGIYWRGTYDHNTDLLDINVAKNEKQVRDFSKQIGTPLGDFIPEWNLVFDPHLNTRVDDATKTVNTFQPTVYMQAAQKKNPVFPKLIHRVIHHALGGDPAITEHFINWLAFIVQFRDRAKTAWVLHGSTGTGKGLIMNNIMRPLLGKEQTAARRAEDLNEPYNAYLEKCFLVLVDEIEVKALVNERGVMSKLKNFITEEYITVRPMYSAAHEVRNYASWIFASNKTDPIMIDKEDRRFNVGKYQSAKLIITKKEIEEQIPRELQGFYDYLAQYPVNVSAAGTPLDTEDRRNIIAISEIGIDSVSDALLKGDFGFFVAQLPNLGKVKTNPLEANKDQDYIDVLSTVLERAKPDGTCNVSRDELRTVFKYLVGLKKDETLAFTNLVKHHRIHFTKIRIGTKTTLGLRLVWDDVSLFGEYRDQLAPPKIVPTKPMLKVVNK